MDRFSVKGSQLAEAFGCSKNHISEIRTGKCSPPINRFWELLETMETLAPGAKLYFSRLMVGSSSMASIPPKDLLETAEMDKEEIAETIVTLVNKLKGEKGNRTKSRKNPDASNPQEAVLV
ncbi:hypothetical protein IQ235_00895 [Oscillatoriales cyanobacterium LEGE 11467]|uniref:Uncharacterized protein n=1 Tax=Zarconia navalis LEGE 11467 TaxID=1828826 RepID=A0A928Z5I8_9CYAN|nr:hypothetical protein [Zarconia navalis]MBE9039352.1 hypothetical protein [Zarconia navalis LEGE 11467]